MERTERQTGMIRRGGSTAPHAEQAVAELAAQLGADELDAMIFFCSPDYDLAALAQAMQHRFTCPGIGCTTAGEILSPVGYRQKSLVGVGFASREITLEPFFIPSLAEFVDTPHYAPLPSCSPGKKDSQFAFLLIDGTSMLEERTVAELHHMLRGVPLIGGSAGDGLRFQNTSIYHEGAFHQRAAVLALVSTSLPFKTFQFQHFAPTGTKLVVTGAETASRRVTRINGQPAAAEYARIVGVAQEDLSPSIFASRPLMLRIGNDYYVRSIQQALPDGSLTFYCAVESGMVLTLATSGRLPEHLAIQMAQLARDVPGLRLVIGCDCILRRIELEQRNELASMAGVLAPYPLIGFSTYGEQYGGVHMNQTLTGIALGTPRS